MCSKTEFERQVIDSKTPIALEKHGITAGRVLGKGCYSCVIMGLSSFGPVAVKVIDLQRVSRTIINKNIPREIECIRSLQHPNIIKYIQHIKSEYCVYIVMEFAENGCVLDFLNAQENIGEVQSRRWFKQLLDAVTYCHARGVVHRDIKCDNLLLGRNNKLKLADFGFARAHMREQDVSETYCGSPIYTAPEVLLESPYVPHYSDIWSMGVVLFCFLYGRLPFTEQTYRRVIRQVQCKLIFPKSVFVSTACKHVLEKMIAPLRRRCYLPELINDPWVLSGPTRSSDSTMTAKKCFLRPLDASHEPILLHDNTATTIGRGPVTKIRDSKCSRTQVMLVAEYDSNIVTATQIGRNLGAFNGQEIAVNKSVVLQHGQVLELLSGQYPYMVDFDPPPGKIIVDEVRKRRVDEVSDSEEEDTEMKKKAKLEKISTKLGHWSIVQDSLLTFKSTSIENRSKIAGFDLDKTIIDTISKAIFPKDENDWKFMYKNTESKLESLYKEGFKIVIFTNQAGLTNSSSIKSFKNKIEKIVSKFKFCVEVYISIGRAFNRKPCPGMWEAMVAGNGGTSINMVQSFYCGDAAGREASGAKKADFSQADILFARNIGLKFVTPEECFLNEKCTRKIRLTAFDAASLPNDVPLCDPETKQIVSSRQELVLLVGSPASGKSHFALKQMVPNKYARVNRDELRTMEKCLREAEHLLESGNKVVIDNTNGSVESRAKFVELAKKCKVPVRALIMKVTLPHALHNNKFRQLIDSDHAVLSDFVIRKYFENYKEPQLEEGFADIVKINFWPIFSKPEHEKLYKMFLLEK